MQLQGAHVVVNERLRDDLFELAEKGSAERFLMLISAGTDPLTIHPQKYTFPLCAAKNYNFQMAEVAFEEVQRMIPPKAGFLGFFSDRRFVDFVNYKDGDGKSVLNYAANAGNGMFARKLLLYGATVDESILESAILSDCGPLVHQIMKDRRWANHVFAKPDPQHIQTTDELTALQYAAACGKFNAVRELLIAGANMNAHCKVSLKTALHFAMSHENSSRCAKLLINSGVEIDPIDSSGATPLGIASTEGFDHFVSLLLMHGAQANNKNVLAQRSLPPLLAAIRNNHLACTLLLFKNGKAHANYIVDVQGRKMPLIVYAAEQNQSVVLHVLTSNPSQCIIHATIESTGENALHRAVALGHHESVTVLHQVGFALNKVTKKGDTALHLAVAHEQVECAEALLKKTHSQDQEKTKIDINICDVDKNTPLMRACKQFVALDVGDRNFQVRCRIHMRLIQILLEQGADKSIPDAEGVTPLSYIVGHLQYLLLANGSKISHKILRYIELIQIFNTYDENILSPEAQEIFMQLLTEYSNEQERSYKDYQRAPCRSCTSCWTKLVRVLESTTFQKGELNKLYGQRLEMLLGCCECSNQLLNRLFDKCLCMFLDAFRKQRVVNGSTLDAYLECLEHLIRFGADCTRRNAQNETCLELVCGVADFEAQLIASRVNNNLAESPLVRCFNLIRDKGATLPLTTNVGLKVLRCAYLNAYSDIVRFLLIHPPLRDYTLPLVLRGEHALHRAAERGDCEEVINHLSNGVDINTLTADGDTALHIAVQRRRVKVVNTLLEKNGQPNLLNGRGNTSLHLACNQRENFYRFGSAVNFDFTTDPQLSLIHLLLSNGAELTIPNAEGRTVLEKAADLRAYHLLFFMLNSGADTGTFQVPELLVPPMAEIACRNCFWVSKGKRKEYQAIRKQLIEKLRTLCSSPYPYGRRNLISYDYKRSILIDKITGELRQLVENKNGRLLEDIVEFVIHELANQEVEAIYGIAERSFAQYVKDHCPEACVCLELMEEDTSRVFSYTEFSKVRSDLYTHIKKEIVATIKKRLRDFFKHKFGIRHKTFSGVLTKKEKIDADVEEKVNEWFIP